VIADRWEISPAGGPYAAPVACRSTRAFGTVALVAVTCGERSGQALEMLESDLRAVDDAGSRFRADSELRQVERDSRGQPLPVSPLLFELLEVAMTVAVQTSGTVDPTVWVSIVVPFASSYQPLWTGLGTVALDLMLAVAVSSALRQHLGARTWRILHGRSRPRGS
jgi:hypothetical protein